MLVGVVEGLWFACSLGMFGRHFFVCISGDMDAGTCCMVFSFVWWFCGENL